MKRLIAEKILEKIEQYDRILIFRHRRPDGDCTGSTKGLQVILKLTYPQKEIYLQNCDFAEYMEFLGPEDGLIDDELYKDALGIVLDTATTDRISNQKYSLCREIIKIDHHIPVESYGNIEWVEENKSSACEMIAELYTDFRDRLKINKYAATCIYTGMVTDSGRFRFRSVSGDTMRSAGAMLDLGVDLDRLHAHLYLREPESFRFESYVYSHMNITENGVAYMYVSMELQKEFGLSQEQASTAVSYMDSIKGCLIWLAFIENDDGSIRVRLRSRFATVDKLASRYNGGGHDCASGATVYSQEEMEQLIKDADEMVGNYKSANEDWL